MQSGGSHRCRKTGRNGDERSYPQNNAPDTSGCSLTGKSYRGIAAACDVSFQAIRLSLRRAGIVDPTIKRKDRAVYGAEGLCIVCGQVAFRNLRCWICQDKRTRNREAARADWELWGAVGSPTGKAENGTRAVRKTGGFAGLPSSVSDDDGRKQAAGGGCQQNRSRTPQTDFAREKQ